MCVIIYKPKNTNVPKKTLQDCFKDNSQGAGFMYAENGTLHICKGYMDFKEFNKAFRTAEKKDVSYILHFRTATAGAVSTEMCHPFFVNRNLGFCHNGILDMPKNVLLSDTALFVRDVLRKLPKDFLIKPELLFLIESYAKQSQSRFAFLDNKGKVTLCNEEAGKWEQNLWFSNLFWKLSSGMFFGHWPSGAGLVPIEDEEQQWAECGGCGAYCPEDELTLIGDLRICENCVENFRM